MKKILHSLLLLIILLLLAGTYSVMLGQDVNWDLFNYHLYNPFALLYGHIGSDFMAAGVHSCLNPLLDLYFYFIFTEFFASPRIIAFLMGIPFGFLLWQIYYLSKDLFEECPHPTIYAWLVTIFSATAAGILSQVGTTTNEIFCNIFCVGALHLFVRFIKYKKIHFLYCSSLLLGMIVGLKLTTLPFACALSGTMILYLYKYKKIFMLRNAFFIVLIFIGGFLLTNGYFMWKWYSLYKNPIFPYYNNLFQSPYFSPVYLTETRFFPKSFVQWIFYPAYWAFSATTLVAESPVQDARIFCGLIFLVLIIFIKRQMSEISKDKVFFLGICFLGTYLLWLKQFCILRYGGMLEIFSAIFIVKFCVLFFKNRWSIYAGLALLGVLAIGYQIPDWRHQNYASKAIVFDNKPVIEDNSLVFFMHLPSSFLAPLLNKKARYMGGFQYIPEEYPKEFQSWAKQRNNIQPQYYQFNFETMQREIIKKHQGPIYIVSIDWPMLVNEQTLARFGLKSSKNQCHAFKTNATIYSPKLAICKVYKNE